MSENVETRDYEIDGIRLAISDSAGSQAARWIAHEMAIDEYRLRRIPFDPGDVVIDVGAHVGLFSLYLAARHPAITIVALEPEPGNFARLAANIARNRAFNVLAFNLAVTADGRPFPISCPPVNTGGAGGYCTETTGYRESVAASVRLDEIFDRFVPDRCKLLKLDCEGAEHEILPACESLGRVDWFSAEFHINRRLEAAGHSSERLLDHVATFIPLERLAVKAITIGQ